MESVGSLISRPLEYSMDLLDCYGYTVIDMGMVQGSEGVPLLMSQAWI